MISVKEPQGNGENKCNSDVYECEICGRIFDNRYNNLVHIAGHIIIPLPKVWFQKCQLCPKYCTSALDLKGHYARGHGFLFDCRVVLSHIDNELRFANGTEGKGDFEPVEDFEDGVGNCNEFDGSVSSIKTEYEDEVIIENHNKLKEDFVEIDIGCTERCSDLQPKAKPLFRFEEDDLLETVTSDNQETETKNIFINNNFKDPVIVPVNPKSLDLITDINLPRVHDEYRNGYQSIITFEDDYENDRLLNEVISYSDPIDYDVLVQAGEFACKRCGRIYRNRLLLIKHETSHMRWIRPSPSFCCHCDRYIANGPRSLHNHRKHSHPDVFHVSGKVPKLCTVCGLKYANYSQHRLNYHTAEGLIDKSVDENGLTEGSPYSVTKTFDVCELCYSFFKMKQNCKYIVMGDTQFKGRRPCARCGKEYFVLKSVKRVTTRRSRGWKHKRTVLSKEDRLKIIHKRLKNMR